MRQLDAREARQSGSTTQAFWGMKRAAYFSIRFGKTDRVWASSCRPLLDGSLSATSSLLTENQKRKVKMLEPELSQHPSPCSPPVYIRSWNNHQASAETSTKDVRVSGQSSKLCREEKVHGRGAHIGELTKVTTDCRVRDAPQALLEGASRIAADSILLTIRLRPANNTREY